MAPKRIELDDAQLRTLEPPPQPKQKSTNGSGESTGNKKGAPHQDSRSGSGRDRSAPSNGRKEQGQKAGNVLKRLSNKDHQNRPRENRGGGGDFATSHHQDGERGTHNGHYKRHRDGNSGEHQQDRLQGERAQQVRKVRVTQPAELPEARRQRITQQAQQPSSLHDVQPGVSMTAERTRERERALDRADSAQRTIAADRALRAAASTSEAVRAQTAQHAQQVRGGLNRGAADVDQEAVLIAKLDYQRKEAERVSALMQAIDTLEAQTRLLQSGRRERKQKLFLQDLEELAALHGYSLQIMRGEAGKVVATCDPVVAKQPQHPRSGRGGAPADGFVDGSDAATGRGGHPLHAPGTAHVVDDEAQWSNSQDDGIVAVHDARLVAGGGRVGASAFARGAGGGLATAGRPNTLARMRPRVAEL